MHIVTFMANMKSYPVAAAILIMALFVVIARVTIGITQRLIRSIYARGNPKYRDELIRMVRFPSWTILPLLGVIVIIQWLNPLPQYQYALLGLLKTLILLVFLTSFNQFMSAIFLFWREKPDIDDAVIDQIESIGKAVVIIAGLAILLSIWQVDLAPLLASAGVLGIVVAIAARDSLSNLFGGLSLLLDRPFKKGDYVVLESGERGKVIWIGIRSTRIQTRDDVQIAIPNSIMAGTKIINESAPNPRFRIHIKTGVAYGSNIDLVEETLLKIARDNPKISSFPEPRVRFREFGDYNLIVELLCWATQPQERGLVVHQLNKTIYTTFEEKNISMPFPQREIYLRQFTETGSAPTDGAIRKGNSE